MIFGYFPLDRAEGLLLAHSLHLSGRHLKKGQSLSAQDIALLKSHGLAEVMGGQLENDDIPEDAAVAALAEAVCGPGLDMTPAYAGRCNFIAQKSGLLLLNPPALLRFNQESEEMTLATAADQTPLEAGRLAATLKIIPFALRQSLLARSLAGISKPLLSCIPFAPLKTMLVHTLLPGTPDKLLRKTEESLAARLAILETHIESAQRCAHQVESLATLVASLLAHRPELLIIAGASAITDRRDVVPAALKRAGAEIIHFGMPVDPGNLLLLARKDLDAGATTTIIGLPSCARSPARNGFDFILERAAARLCLGSQDIMAMGQGGLLKDNTSRVAPRSPGRSPGRSQGKRAPPKRFAALILAAGRSSRMGAANKLLLPLHSKPLIHHVCASLHGLPLSQIMVVTGHDHQAVTEAVAQAQTQFSTPSPPLEVTHNPAYASGFSYSLRCGLKALERNGRADAFLILLGDMPLLSAATLKKLMAAFDPLQGNEICLPSLDGKWGNPALIGRRFLPEMMELQGDVGAKGLIAQHHHALHLVAVNDQAVVMDIDTPEDLQQCARHPIHHS